MDTTYDTTLGLGASPINLNLKTKARNTQLLFYLNKKCQLTLKKDG